LGVLFALGLGAVWIAAAFAHEQMAEPCAPEAFVESADPAEQ
jgi:hypothetical protein